MKRVFFILVIIAAGAGVAKGQCNPKVTAASGGKDTAICSGERVQLDVKLGTCLGADTTYQWQDSTKGRSWRSITDSTRSTYFPSSSSDTTYYRCIVTIEGVENMSDSVRITVKPNNTITAGSKGKDRTVCINTNMDTIVYYTTGATGIDTSGLPSGLDTVWRNGSFTIEGMPKDTGTFKYYVTLTGGCGTVTDNGTITVIANNTVTPTNTSRELCIYDTLSPSITHTTTGATGIGNPINLPPGVYAKWVNDTIIISGTPMKADTFNYDIPLIGGCGDVHATGKIIVNPLPNVEIIPSDTVICLGTIIQMKANHLIGGTWLSNPMPITTSGLLTSTSAGKTVITYKYTDGNSCSNTDSTTITVNDTSAINCTKGNTTQNVCYGTAIDTITCKFGGSATSAYINGLPAGLTSSVNINDSTVTISGTPIKSGIYPYTITTSGHSYPCGAATISGTITVDSLPIITNPISDTICGIGMVTLSATVANGGDNVYWWSASVEGTKRGTGSSWQSLIDSTTIYYAEAYNSTTKCTSSSRTAVVATVNEPSTITSKDTTQQVCAGNSIKPITCKFGGSATSAYINGLPAGLTSYVSDSTITISGMPTESGTYTYTITTSGHNSPCHAATITGTITVYSLPEVAISGQNPVCANQKGLVYTATPYNDDYTYYWEGIENVTKINSTSNTVTVNWGRVDFASVGKLLVKVTNNNNGCTNTVSQSIAISPSDAPDLYEIVAKIDKDKKPYMLIYPQSVPSDDFIYQWYKNDTLIEGATEQFFYPKDGLTLESTCYTVYVAKKNSVACGNFTECYPPPKLSVASGNPFTVSGKLFTISPNPADNGCFTVSFNRDLLQEGQNYSLTLYSVMGEKIWEQKVSSLDNISVTKTMAAGFYTLVLIGNKQQYSEKVIVK